MTGAAEHRRFGVPCPVYVLMGLAASGPVDLRALLESCLNRNPPADWWKERRLPLFKEAERLIFSAVDRLGGSISAEHGIGRAKKRAFLDRIDPVSLDLATRIRAALDPTGLLSPGRIFDLDSSENLTGR